LINMGNPDVLKEAAGAEDYAAGDLKKRKRGGRVRIARQSHWQDAWRDVRCARQTPAGSRTAARKTRRRRRGRYTANTDAAGRAIAERH
jgi:hypothetical protein